MSNETKSLGTEAAELLPCPFCGEAAEIFESFCGDSSYPSYSGECSKCLAEVGLFDSKREAVLNWNRRDDDKIVRERGEQEAFNEAAIRKASRSLGSATPTPQTDVVNEQAGERLPWSKWRDLGLEDFLNKLGQDLLEIEQRCPCGARPESPNSHPHVGGCPVERAVRRSIEFAKGRGALTSSATQSPTESRHTKRNSNADNDTKPWEFERGEADTKRLIALLKKCRWWCDGKLTAAMVEELKSEIDAALQKEGEKK